jgi:hypothetical protein
MLLAFAAAATTGLLLLVARSSADCGLGGRHGRMPLGCTLQAARAAIRAGLDLRAGGHTSGRVPHRLDTLLRVGAGETIAPRIGGIPTSS